MSNSEKDTKTYKIIDEFLLKLKTKEQLFFETKNLPEEYSIAKNLINEYSLVQLANPKNNTFQLTKTGLQVINNGGFEKNKENLQQEIELRDRLKLEKIQSDINKHLENRRFNVGLIIAGLILFIIFAIRWVMSK